LKESFYDAANDSQHDEDEKGVKKPGRVVSMDEDNNRTEPLDQIVPGGVLHQREPFASSYIHRCALFQARGYVRIWTQLWLTLAFK